MAGVGPGSKSASLRARQNAPSQLKRLPARGRGDKPAPAWPLRADRELAREVAETEITLERLREQRNDATDGRTIKRLEKELDSALARHGSLEARIEDQAESEAQLWIELWKTPQATVWEDYGWVREVALFVRCSLKAEEGDMRAAGEARQRSDRLGLSPKAMRYLGWEIERVPEPATVETPAVKPAKGEPRPDPRVALRVVS